MKTKKNAPETTPATTGLETTPETAAAAPKEPAEKPAPKKASAKKAATKKATKPAKASKPAKGAKKAGTNKPAARAAAEKPAPRETRKAMVLAMIARKNGATLDEIMAATDWQRHTVRGFISIAGRDPEIQIESTKNEKGQRVYRLK